MGERAGAYLAWQAGQSKRRVKRDWKELGFETGSLKRQNLVPANGLPQGMKPLHSGLLPPHIFAFFISVSVYFYSCPEKSGVISFKVKISNAARVAGSPAWRGE